MLPILVIPEFSSQERPAPLKTGYSSGYQRLRTRHSPAHSQVRRQQKTRSDKSRMRVGVGLVQVLDGAYVDAVTPSLTGHLPVMM